MIPTVTAAGIGIGYLYSRRHRRESESGPSSRSLKELENELAQSTTDLSSSDSAKAAEEVPFNGFDPNFLNLAEPMPIKQRRSAPRLPSFRRSVNGFPSQKKYKLVFLGDQSCGKSSIVRRVIHDEYRRKYMATVGVDLGKLTIHVPEASSGVRYQIWDSSGQERFRSTVHSYIRDSHAVIVVFDVSNRETFDNAANWVKEVRAIRGNRVLIALVGAKSDVSLNERKVGFLELEKRAEEEGFMFMETSARAGYNVSVLFHSLAVRLLSWNSESGAVL